MDLRHVKSWRVASVSAIISLLLAVMPVNPAHGNVVGDAWGIACDPLKLGHASDNILASVERINEVIGQLKGLEGQTNEDVEARLKQLQGIVNDVISGVNQDIQKAEQAVSAIERQVYNDVIDIVQRVECLAQDLATVQLQEAIVNALNTVREAHLNIKILGIEVATLDAHEVKVTDPDLVYISTRDAYLAYIQTLGQNDAAYMIVSKLGNISRIAFLTRCSYRNNPLDAPLLREELEYYNEAAAWTNTLNVKMIQ